MSLTLYHTSDLHDHRAIVEPLRRLRRAQPNFLFDCGDALRGSQTVYYRNEPIVSEIAAANYTAQAMGNREFHYLFGCVRARIARMAHPVLCANLVDVRGRPLPFEAQRDFTCDDAGQPWRVRVFGLLVPQYRAGSPWERLFGWRFLDPFAVAERIAAETPPEITLIALSHLGLRADRELAARVPRLEVILGGHSHDTLAQPEVVADVPIVHAGPYGKYCSVTALARSDGRAHIEAFALQPLLA